MFNWSPRDDELCGSRDIALRILTSALDGVSGQLHALAALLLVKVSRYALNKRLVGPESRYGCYGEHKRICPCRESNSGSPVVQPMT
jgi:hypothetical protein